MGIGTIAAFAAPALGKGLGSLFGGSGQPSRDDILNNFRESFQLATPPGGFGFDLKGLNTQLNQSTDRAVRGADAAAIRGARAGGNSSRQLGLAFSGGRNRFAANRDLLSAMISGRRANKQLVQSGHANAFQNALGLGGQLSKADGVPNALQRFLGTTLSEAGDAGGLAGMLNSNLFREILGLPPLKKKKDE